MEECSSSHHATRSIELDKVRIACLAHADRVFTCSRDRVVLPSEYGAVVAEQLSTAATVVLQHDDEHGQHRRYRGVPCDTYPAAGEHRELSVAQLVIGNHFWAHHPRVAHDLTVGRRNTIICSLQGLHRDWLLRLG